MTQAYIAIGYLCNQKCSFCPCTKEESKYPSPSLKELENTVEQMKKKSGIDAIVVSGGEPTLHPDFVKFIQYLCQLGLKVTILSNSERFSDDRFVEKLIKAIPSGQVEVITTIHSHLAQEHENINGTKGSFQRSINGLLNLNKKGIHVTVKHCITKANYRELYEFYNFIDSIFPKCVDIQMCSIDYCGLNEKNKHEFMVVFPELEQYFEKMFDAYIEKLENGDERHMYCINMPLCSCDPYYWQFFAPKIQSYEKYSSPDENGELNLEAGIDNFIGTFGQVCRKCKVESICAGTYRTAFEYFGDQIVCAYK